MPKDAKRTTEARYCKTTLELNMEEKVEGETEENVQKFSNNQYFMTKQ